MLSDQLTGRVKHRREIFGSVPEKKKKTTPPFVLFIMNRFCFVYFDYRKEKKNQKKKHGQRENPRDFNF